MGKIATHLDPATLSAIDSLDLRARMIVEGLMTGMHRSPYQGVSIEFAQHRPYTPGDDLRHLDWKVYGRADKLYLKLYQKETNLDLIILVDTSGSMSFASDPVGSARPWSKYDHAAGIAAALGHLSLGQRDRVGLILFDDTVQTATRVSNTRGHWRSIVEALVSGGPGHPGRADSVSATTRRGTDLARLFEQVLAKLTQRSLIVLISDLFDEPESLERGLARVQFNRHDLIVFQTLDPAELTFPFRAPARFVGLEGDGEIALDPPALRDAYLRTLHDHLHRVEQIARRFRFDHLLLDSSQPLGAPLSRFLAYRSATLQKGK